MDSPSDPTIHLVFARWNQFQQRGLDEIAPSQHVKLI
jgi:hypothetical protein